MDDDFQPVSSDLAFAQLVNEAGLRSLKSSASMRAPFQGTRLVGLFDVSKEIILVTGAIMLRALNASRYITGSVATVDGGFLLT
jgi:hypothetical protein